MVMVTAHIKRVKPYCFFFSSLYLTPQYMCSMWNMWACSCGDACEFIPRVLGSYAYIATVSLLYSTHTVTETQCFICSLEQELHWARRPISLVVNYKYVQVCKSL